MSKSEFNRTPSPTVFREPEYKMVDVTHGSSVLGIRYEHGVMIAADTLVSNGSSEKTYPDIQRVYKMNESLVLAGSCDYPDFQQIRAQVENKITADFCFEDPNYLKPSMLACWLSNTIFDRVLEKNPLSFEAVVGGVESNGTPYLAAVDRHGGLEADFLAATGPAHMGIPMIWGSKPSDREFTAMEAAKLIENIMTLVFYRNDAAVVNTYQVGICSNTMCKVVGPFKVNESWAVAEVCHGC